jgi:hypothetical protein
MPASIRQRRHRAFRGPLVHAIAGALVGVLAVVTASAAWGQTQVHPVTVVMTVTSTTLNFRSVSGLAPATVPDGKVAFRLDNKTPSWRTFTIGGKTTPQIAPGKSSTLTVTLPGAGQYYYTVGAKDEDLSVNGVVLAVDSCTHPRKSTVIVKLLEGPLSSVPEHVPCGTVTFVLKNTEKGDDSFEVSLPGTTEPAPGSPTGEIGGGKTLRMTVNFRFKGIVSFGSNEMFRNTLYNEFGALAIV